MGECRGREQAFDGRQGATCLSHEADHGSMGAVSLIFILRAEAYRELFWHRLDPGLVDQIRSATNGNYALGSSRFTAEVERVLGRKATRGKPGRPKQAAEPD